MKFGNFLAPSLPYAKDLEQRFELKLEEANLDIQYLDLDEVFQQQELDAVKLTNGKQRWPLERVWS